MLGIVDAAANLEERAPIEVHLFLYQIRITGSIKDGRLVTTIKLELDADQLIVFQAYNH